MTYLRTSRVHCRQSAKESLIEVISVRSLCGHYKQSYHSFMRYIDSYGTYRQHLSETEVREREIDKQRNRRNVKAGKQKQWRQERTNQRSRQLPDNVSTFPLDQRQRAQIDDTGEASSQLPTRESMLGINELFRD